VIARREHGQPAMTFVDPALSQGMEAPFREAVRANLPKTHHWLKTPEVVRRRPRSAGRASMANVLSFCYFEFGAVGRPDCCGIALCSSQGHCTLLISSVQGGSHEPFTPGD
jgi:hypothetical protein